MASNIDYALFEEWTIVESPPDTTCKLPYSMSIADMESMKSVIHKAKTQPGVPFPYGRVPMTTGLSWFIYNKEGTLWKIQASFNPQTLVSARKLLLEETTELG